MAGFDININDSGDDQGPQPVDPSKIAPENVAGLNPGKSANRLILEKRINDYRRQAGKIEGRLQSLTQRIQESVLRGVRGAKSVDEIKERVATKLNVNLTRVAQISRDLDSAYDNVKTRIQTNREKKASDLQQVQGIQDVMEQTLQDTPKTIRDLLKTVQDSAIQEFNAREAAKQKKKQDAQTAKDARSEQARLDQMVKKHNRDTRSIARDRGRRAAEQFIESKRNLPNPRMDNILEEADRIQRNVEEQFIRDNQIITANVVGQGLQSKGVPPLPPPPGPPGRHGGQNYGGGSGGSGGGFSLSNLQMGMAKSAVLVAVVSKIVKSVADTVEKGISNTLDFGADGSASKNTGMLLRNLPVGPIFGNMLGNIGEKVIGKLDGIIATLEKDSLAFSPELLGASIDRQLALLEDNMRRGDEAGRTASRVYRAQTDLLLSANKFQDALLNLLGPALEKIIKLLTVQVDFLTAIANSFGGIAAMLDANKATIIALFTPQFWIGVIIAAWKRVKNQQDDATRMVPDIDAFMRGRDPNNQNNWDPNIAPHVHNRHPGKRGLLP